jgi:acetyl-CoA C-acetyltransferase
MAPYLVLKGRAGYRMGPGTIEDAMLHDALTCAVENYHMGMTAENIAKRYAISREEQDSLAVLSHEKQNRLRRRTIIEGQQTHVLEGK